METAKGIPMGEKTEKRYLLLCNLGKNVCCRMEGRCVVTTVFLQVGTTTNKPVP